MPVTVVFAAEQPTADQKSRIMQVDGRGQARVDPDQASLNFAIETSGSTAQEAEAQNAEIAKKVLAVLKSKVGAGDKVEAGAYTLAPVFAGMNRPVFSRYTNWAATINILVECDPSAVGDVLDAAQAAGAGRGSSNPTGDSGKATVELNISASALTAKEASRLGDEK